MHWFKHFDWTWTWLKAVQIALQVSGIPAETRFWNGGGAKFVPATQCLCGVKNVLAGCIFQLARTLILPECGGTRSLFTETPLSAEASFVAEGKGNNCATVEGVCCVTVGQTRARVGVSSICNTREDPGPLCRVVLLTLSAAHQECLWAFNWGGWVLGAADLNDFVQALLPANVVASLRPPGCSSDEHAEMASQEGGEFYDHDCRSCHLATDARGRCFCRMGLSSFSQLEPCYHFSHCWAEETFERVWSV